MINELPADYQWPSSFIYPKKYEESFANKPTEALIEKIENYFRKYYYNKVLLMPSGRAAIALLIKYKKLNRAHTVYVSKWSSHCLYSTIGALCNVSSDLVKPNLILINHKWGTTKRFCNQLNKPLMIEDSVDSIHNKPEGLFPNESSYEIISLPKIMGSYSGGLIITRDDEFYKYGKEKQKDNQILSKIQSRKKNQAARNELPDFETWFYHEFLNFGLDKNALMDIEANLANFTKNKEIISNRREMVHKKFDDIQFDSGRLGPVVLFPKKKYKIIKDKAMFMVRNYSFSDFIESENYEDVYILPVHYKIKSNVFKSMLASIVEKI
jgi:putative PLP-dependent aminotransferase (TIGR04422 family)